MLREIGSISHEATEPRSHEGRRHVGTKGLVEVGGFCWQVVEKETERRRDPSASLRAGCATKGGGIKRAREQGIQGSKGRGIEGSRDQEGMDD